MNTDKSDSCPTFQRHPGLGERLINLEAHLAYDMVGVRWRRCTEILYLKRFRVYVIVPSPPVSLLDRVRFIEDHIMRLERDYPPWAALHFINRIVVYVPTLISLFAWTHSHGSVAASYPSDTTDSAITFDINVPAETML